MTAVISHNDYNQIQSIVANILGTSSSGYGVNVQSSQVSAGDIITSAQWSLLEYEVSLIKTHQTGSSPVFNRTNPVQSSYVTGLTTTVNNLNSNPFLVGQSATTLVGLHTSPSSWVTNYRLTTEMSWATSLRANYFFNLGSSISPLITVSGSDAAAWQSLVNQANSVAFNHAQFYGSFPYTQSFSSGGKSITVRFTLSGSVLSVELDFETSSGTLNNLTVTSKFNIIYSIGAIPAILPQVQISSAIVSAAPVGFLTYSPNPIPDFTAPVGQGAPQTFTLINNANYTCHITGITSTGFAFDSYQIDTLTLAPNETTDITVTYIGTQPGTNHGNIIVNSDINTLTIAATVITQVVVVVAPPPPPPPPPPPGPPPAPTPAPTPAPPINIQSTVIIETINKLGTYQYPISLAVSGTRGSNYQAVLAGGSSGNSSYPGIFTLVNASGSTASNATFTLVFNTSVSGNTVSNGVYTNTINFTLTPSELNQSPINLTIPVTITVSIVSQSLGTWLSPINESNGVIGMDYSIINGQRYLTIGFGISTGAYTYPWLSYAQKLLGYYGTNLIGGSGPVAYPVKSYTYSTFLKVYGVWAEPREGAFEWDVTSTPYKFYAPAGQFYQYEFAVDNYGSFYIDDHVVSTQNDRNAYGTSLVGSTYLSAGVHTIYWDVINTGGPGAVGIRITDPNTNTDIWSTLATTYYYTNNTYGPWSEVYRIPITGPGTYYSNLQNQVYTQFAPGQSQTYGSYFGFQAAAGSMFTVVANSANDLSITLNGLRAVDAINTDVNTTLNEVQYLFYYYSTADERLNNLADPVNGSQTQYFTGFSSSGAIQTILLNYPTGNLGVGWCSRCSGCAGGGGGE